MLRECLTLCLVLVGVSALRTPPEISDSEKNFIESLSEKFLNVQPGIDFSKIAKESSKCYKDSVKYLSALKTFEFWALEMHDASSKVPSGILYGNVHSYGNFDECLQAIPPNNEFQGQYCLATMQVTIPNDTPYLNFLKRQALSYELFTSEINDTNHIAPSTSNIRWAFCLPSSCSPQHLERLLQSQLNDFTRDMVLSINVYVDPKLCQVKETLTSKINRSSIMAFCFFGTIFIISILSFESNSWLQAFSLKANLKALFSTEQHPSDISVIHGIRFFLVLLIFFGHKMVMLSYYPLFFRTQLIESSSLHPGGVIFKGVHVITDVFLMLSGLVASYILIEQSERMRKMPIVGAYVLRYIRIIPSVLVVMLIVTFILPLLGDGPLFPYLINHPSQLCKANGWMNILMLQNFFIPFNEMCMMFSYHVSVDFQLFLLVPFMVIILMKWPKIGSYGFIILSIIISIGNYFITKSKGLSRFVFIGMSYQDGNDLMDKHQSLTQYRFPAFAIGVLLGVALRKCKTFKITKIQSTIGWTLAAGSIIGIYYNMYLMSGLDYELNTTFSAVFSSIVPLVLCMTIGWIIFVSQFGDSNFLINFLQWKGFIITTNISYSIFLVQFPILFYFAGTARAVYSSSTYSWIFANFEETLVIVVAAISLTLFIEIPVKNVCNLILKSKKQEKKKN